MEPQILDPQPPGGGAPPPSAPAGGGGEPAAPQAPAQGATTSGPPEPKGGSAEPAGGAPAPGNGQEEPDSWQRFREEVRAHNPGWADRLGKLEGSLRRDKDVTRETEAARAAVEPAKPAVDTSILAALDHPVFRRILGREEGDPYEGLTVEDEDFAIPDVPDEVAKDPQTKAAFAAWAKQLVEGVRASTKAYTHKFSAKVTKATYEPVVKRAEEAKAQAESQQRIAATMAACRKIPGMDDDAAFALVRDRFAEEVAKGNAPRGEAGFRMVWSQMVTEHPEWVAPKAAKGPEVVVRPAPRVDPLAAVRGAGAQFAGSAPGGGGRSTGSFIGNHVSEYEFNTRMAATPEFKRIMQGDYGSFGTKAEAIQALSKQLRGG